MTEMSFSDADRLARAQEIAIARDQARAERNFALADELRAQVRALGFLITDTAAGPVLDVAPAFHIADSALDDGSALGVGARVLVPVLVDGWVDDAQNCVDALLAHEDADCAIVIVDIGNHDGVGTWAHAAATSHADRVTALHLPATAAHWSRIHLDLISRCASEFYCAMDPSTILTGPAISLLCDQLADNAQALAAGWRGANVDLVDQWRSVQSAEGNVDVLLSYLMVVRTDVARVTGPDAKARFYRNADIEWSLTLRAAHVDAHGSSPRLLAVGDALPATQGRHHGYHDSQPEFRDRESRKTYDRILQRYRGREEILAVR